MWKEGHGESCFVGTVSVWDDGKFWKWLVGMIAQLCECT